MINRRAILTRAYPDFSQFPGVVYHADFTRQKDLRTLDSRGNPVSAFGTTTEPAWNNTWTANTGSTITPSQPNDPNGGSGAFKFAQNNGHTGTVQARATFSNNASLRGADLYFRIKYGGWQWVRLTGAGTTGVWLDLLNGVVGTIQPGWVVDEVSEAANDWITVRARYMPNNADGRDIFVQPAPGNGSAGQTTGNGTDGFFLFDAEWYQPRLSDLTDRIGALSLTQGTVNSQPSVSNGNVLRLRSYDGTMRLDGTPATVLNALDGGNAAVFFATKRIVAVTDGNVWGANALLSVWNGSSQMSYSGDVTLTHVTADDGEWHAYGLAIDSGGTVAAYLDGEADGTGTHTLAGARTAFALGGFPAGAWPSMNGELAHWIAHDGTPSAATIKAISEMMLRGLQ